MNKTSVKLIAALAGLICLYSLLSFFRVSGAELPGLSTLSPETCTVKIFEAPWEDPSDQTEHLLNEEQILQLKELLAKSTFTRFLRSGSPVQIAGGQGFTPSVSISTTQRTFSISASPETNTSAAPRWLTAKNSKS